MLRLYFLVSLIHLDIVRPKRESSESESTRRVSLKADGQSPIGNWGAKKARTARYEVLSSDAEPSQTSVNSGKGPHNQSKSCDICRPNCSHWKSLSRPKRNRESMRWHLKNQTEEQRVEKRKHLNATKRQWYLNLSKERKVEMLKKSNDLRVKRFNKLNDEEKQAAKENHSEKRRRRLEGMTVDERREWHKKNNSYSRKPLDRSQRSPQESSQI